MKDKNREYFIYGIVGTIFLLLYLLLILYVFAIPFVVIAVIFYGILFNKYFFRKKSFILAITISRVLIPAAVVLVLWIGTFGSTLYFIYPKLSPEITVLFLSILFASIGVGGMIINRNSIIKTYEPSFHAFSRVFFSTFFILIPVVALQFIIPVYPLSLMFLFIFISGLFFSGFYMFVDSDSLKKSNNASKMILRSSSVTVYLAILGFIAGLYIELISSPFGIAVLLALIFYSLGGAGVLVHTIYQGTSRNLKTNSMTVFQKFEKEGSVSMSHDIQDMGNALDTFENEGKKEELIIVVAKFLADRGKNVDYIKKSLKSVIDYKLPSSIAIGISKQGTSIYKAETEKRKIITKVVIENISVVGDLNE